MLEKAPTKNGEICYIFIEIYWKRIYLLHAQSKVNLMFKYGKLKKISKLIGCYQTVKYF